MRARPARNPCDRNQAPKPERRKKLKRSQGAKRRQKPGHTKTTKRNGYHPPAQSRSVHFLRSGASRRCSSVRSCFAGSARSWDKVLEGKRARVTVKQLLVLYATLFMFLIAAVVVTVAGTSLVQAS